MSSEISCKNEHDDFCFVCGHLTYYNKRTKDDKKKRYVNAPKFVEEYKKRFNRDPLERIIEWSPQTVCKKCFGEVTDPKRIKTIESAMKWFEPKDHPKDCYFCSTKFEFGANKRKDSSVEYANVASVKRARLISDELAGAAAIYESADAAAIYEVVPYVNVFDDVEEASSIRRQPVFSAKNVDVDEF